MSSISGVSGADYAGIASGLRLRTAADGPAELGIAKKEEAEARGYDAASNNIGAGRDALNIADGALGQVTDYLQRIRELAVKSSNSALLTNDDRAMYQQEIDQLKQGIADIADQTTYNTKKLLDGSFSGKIATDGNGGAEDISGVNSTLAALGIQDFDVTGDFSIDTIDNALNMVNSGRSQIGAQNNGLEYLQNLNSSASYYHTSSQSRLEDLDIPQAVSEKKKQEALQQFAIMMQKKKQEDEERKASMWWTA